MGTLITSGEIRCLDDNLILQPKAVRVIFGDNKQYTFDFPYCSRCNMYRSYIGMKDLEAVVTEHLINLRGWPKYDPITCRIEIV